MPDPQPWRQTQPSTQELEAEAEKVARSLVPVPKQRFDAAIAALNPLGLAEESRAALARANDALHAATGAAYQPAPLRRDPELLGDGQRRITLDLPISLAWKAKGTQRHETVLRGPDGPGDTPEPIRQRLTAAHQSAIAGQTALTPVEGDSFTISLTERAPRTPIRDCTMPVQCKV